MAAARFWRIAQVEPYGGGDIELSEVALYEAETRVDALATVSCTVSPLSGALADLSDDSFTSAVRWDGTNPLPPGFALVWDFGPGTPRDIAKVGLAAPLQATFAHKFVLDSSPDGQSWTTQLQPYPSTAFVGGGAFYELAVTRDPGDPFFNAVVLLLHMDGTPGTAAFTDVTGKTVTAVNNAKLSGTTVKFGSASGAVVEGAGYLSLAGSADFAFAGDFTVEGWIYATAALGCPLVNNQSTTNKFLALYMDTLTSGRVLIDGVDTVTGIVLPGGATWFHYALVRSGTTLRAYVNGVQSGTTATVAGPVGNNQAITLLGSLTHTGFRGCVDELRVTQGVARYMAPFTPPVSAFSDVLGSGSDPYSLYVSLLLHMDGTDGSTVFPDGTGKTVTAIGNAKVSTAQAKFGGASGYFDGTGDGLSFPLAGGLGAGDFTVEMWIYPTASTGYCTLFFAAGAGLYLYNGTIVWYESGGSRCVSGAVALNTWHHVALTRAGTTVRTFLDGVPSGTTFTAATDYSQGTWYIGTNSALGEGYTGYIDEVRVTKGVARYVAAFAPPGAAFPDLVGSVTDPYSANVALLLRMDGANGSTVFTDATGKTVIANGNAQMSTAQSKSGGASAYFDGAGDFLQVADSVDFDLGAANFTIEFWVRFVTVPAAGQWAVVLSQRAGYQVDVGFTLWYGGTDKWTLETSSIGTTGVEIKGFTATAMVAGQWYHVALVRHGNAVNLFLDGVAQTAQPMTGTIFNSSAAMTIGAVNWYYNSVTTYYYFNGYLDDLRITKGVARYTGNFTPSALADLGRGDPYAASVVLLLTFDTDTVDASPAQAVASLYGAPSIVSTGQKYGGGAVSVGTPDYLRYDTVGALGTGDYTLECWVHSRRAPATNSGLLAVGSCVANISTTQGLFL